MELPALPLTPNGKVDRCALPLPDFSGAAAPGTAVVAGGGLPAGPLEAHLLALWTEILGTPHLGTHDNFFEYGGDSLLGLRMVNRLRRQFGGNLSLVAVFDAPTVAALAALLAERHPAGVAALLGTAANALLAPAAVPGPGWHAPCRASSPCRERRDGSPVLR